MDFEKETQNRILNRHKRSLLDINTVLQHFAIISYKVPVERVKKYIPPEFSLWTFFEANKEYALISAVPFRDKDFTFYRVCKQLKFNFFQTNFRTYIIDKKDGSHAAWFFGTTLGSSTCMIPQKIWKMPWERGKYSAIFETKAQVYLKYSMKFSSAHGKAKIDIVGTQNNMKLHAGFKNLDEQIHILTHPVKGYYHTSNNAIGSYEIWHPLMELKEGIAIQAYFEFFEKLELLNAQEMKLPHSVLLTPKIEFDILMPPKVNLSTAIGM